MPNTTTTPNMNLPVPVPGTDPGPDWATNIVADMYGIDSHDHSTGKGVPITPDGLSISSDLPFNGNSATTVKSVVFSVQSVPLTTLGSIYESGVDLYYTDGSGNQVRITQGGSVTGSSGTITGLPSGTASASFAAGTFTFQSATSTPATMAVGPLVIGRSAASSKTVTLAPNAAQAANYNLTFPAAAPAANQYPLSDGSGNLSWADQAIGQIPLGAILGTFPALSGAYSCTATTVADAKGFVKCNGQTVSDGTSPMNGVVIPNLNNTVFLAGSTTSNTSGGAASVTLSTANLASHSHGAGSFNTSLGIAGGTATLTGTTTFASNGHTHNFAHDHQWAAISSLTGGHIYVLNAASSSTTSIPSTFDAGAITTATSGSSLNTFVGNINQSYYTTGAIDAPAGSGATATTNGSTGTGTVGISSTAASLTGSNAVTGTTNTAGSGTAFSILPTYITTLYVMRIK